ncbi:MAG: hypothetical protein J6I37_00665 [Prevotella sp.]|jgi:nucleoside phosphorylase|nr:hypothetical protein [Prevotella sp.]
MELRKRILVVDDDLQNRKGKYASALQGKYEVEYTENADLIFDVIKTVKADLYIVDLDLSSFIDPRTMQSMTVNAILETIGKSKPIILLSGTYKELMDKEKLTPIIKNAAEEGYNICSFFTWDEVLRVCGDDGQGYRDALYSRIDFFINKDRAPYEFGIVCALEEELDPFMEKVLPDSIRQETINGIHYKKSILKTQNGRMLNFIAACSSSMGIADASIIATHMATQLGVKTIYMIGVCGGREAAGVKIGDVVIPSESIAFQRGKLTEDGFSADIESAKPKESGIVKSSKVKEILSELFDKYTSDYLKKNRSTLPLQEPNVHYYAIACADYVIDKKDELDRIAKTTAHRKLCAVDMESYAIFRVGEILNVETMVIKAVMDLTNNKSDKYKPYAAYMAANYLYQLLYREEITFKKFD